MNETSLETTVLILLFAAWYLVLMARKTARRQIDLYDLAMLSTVAVIPAFFVLFPDTTLAITQITGVAFPFVILFGALLAVLFLFMHRLTIKLHRLESDNRMLIQELSILRQSQQQD
ncbi:MAG TPA: DUF2304 domain-containing protein [Pseudomonadales bacterium]